MTFFSCAEKQVKGVKKTKIMATGTDAGKKEYSTLEKLYNDKNYNGYLASSTIFYKKYPDSRFASEVIYKRGSILLGSQRFAEAADELDLLTSNYPNSPYYNGAI